LHVRDRKVFSRPPLVVSNAAELLDPMPLPRDIVQALFGGPEGYETIAAPAAVELSLLNSRFREGEAELPEIRAGPKSVSARSQKQLSRILLDFDTYQWGVTKLCVVDYGVKARFRRAKSEVEVLFCFECDILEIKLNGRSTAENFDFNHNALVKIMRQVFPRDKKIRHLDENRDEKKNREHFVRSWIDQARGD
jgi:hypothetical protein